MAEDTLTLRIGAENLGTVSQVKNFLTDMENAYNSIYTFDLIYDIVNSGYRRGKNLSDDIQYWKNFRNYDYLYIAPWVSLPPSLIVLLNEIRVGYSMPSQDQLILTKVNIQSPGFWEMVGSLNPLQQIREYLKDRHERQKDKNFREAQEKVRGELEIINQREDLIQKRIETLRSAGYSENEIRQVVDRLINQPLAKLGQYQDIGLITTTSEDTQVNSNTNQDII